MPRQNIETLRRAVDAFNRHDVRELQALLAPDAEILPRSSFARVS